LEPLLVDMQRRVRFAALPKEPFVVRFEVRGHHRRFMLLTKTEASLCHQNPGFPEPVCVRGPLAALVAWWRGDMSFVEAQRMGLGIDGPKAFTRAFPKWFDLYPFAHIGPAGPKMSLLARSKSGLRFNEHMDGVDGHTVFLHACKLGLEGPKEAKKDCGGWRVTKSWLRLSTCTPSRATTSKPMSRPSPTRRDCMMPS
jgi:hypothetical protein